jgi:hypothetical protein
MSKSKDGTELSKQEIREMYKWIALDSTYDETDPNHDFIQALISIEEFVAQVLSGDEPAFVFTEWVVERNDLKIFRRKLLELPLANNFAYVIKLLEYYSAEYKYSPHVHLFFQCCFKLELTKEWFSKPYAYTTKRGNKPKHQFELYNDLIDLIRTESRNAEFSGKISDRKFNSNRNFERAAAFITKLFSRRLLVLRVDFAYLPEYANTVTPEEAKADLAHFFFNFRHNKDLSEHLVGYLWKWEFSSLKKMHCHLLFFYDGSKVQDDAYWGNRIGVYWYEVITKGRGRYYNGNTQEHKEKFEKDGRLGIGMISRIHENPEMDTGKTMRDILINKIVKYFLKAEQYLLSVKLENAKGRLYGKGRGTNWRGKKKA